MKQDKVKIILSLVPINYQLQDHAKIILSMVPINYSRSGTDVKQRDTDHETRSGEDHPF